MPPALHNQLLSGDRLPLLNGLPLLQTSCYAGQWADAVWLGGNAIVISNTYSETGKDEQALQEDLFHQGLEQHQPVKWRTTRNLLDPAVVIHVHVPARVLPLPLDNMHNARGLP